MSDLNGTSQENEAFLEAHSHGWNHDDWLGFLKHLEYAGHDVSDPDGIGLALEQEHLRRTLKGAGVKGLGPRRIEAVAREFATLGNLKHVEGSYVAERTGLPLSLAQEIVDRLR